MDGLDALHVYDGSTQKIDLVLLDVVMPNMGGIDAFIALRERCEKLPVLLSSGFTEADSMERLGEFKDGTIGFLKKPYRPKELLQKVQQLVQQLANLAQPLS